MKTTLPSTTNSTNRLPVRAFVLISLALGCFGLSPQARAVCQEGCGIGLGNTFLGEDALLNNFGTQNTAVGANALMNNDTTGTANTAIGAGALASNTGGVVNTAVGAFALFNNTTGANTATGAVALANNTTGTANTGIGAGALYANTTGFGNTATGDGALSDNNGDFNTATGDDALSHNLTGNYNTAVGALALEHSTTGSENTATGVSALNSNSTGFSNTASGRAALFFNTTGSENTASGFHALLNNTTGNKNVALGFRAGSDLTTGDKNIDIGNAGFAGESGTIRIGRIQDQTATFIAGISGATVPTGVAVIVDAHGHLGTTISSARFKTEIQAMDKTSEAILALKPVTFRYKQELDPNCIPQFGLVAEDVEKVNPDLVARDADGKPYTVRYDAVNAMLLNEFLKEHRKVEDQQATITELKSTVTQQKKDFQATVAQLTTRLDEQASQIQKVSAQLEASKPAPQMVNNP